MVLTDENLLLPLLSRPARRYRPCECHDGFSPAAEPCLYLRRTPCGAAEPPPQKGAGGWTFYHADVAGILAHPYVAECDAALTRTMHEEIVRDRRISVDAAWLGRNELLKRIFSPAAEWRELSDYLLGVIAAVARQPYEGDDARQRVDFWPSPPSR